ncbi:hypothetical protein KCP76_05670 [Salmonella enterica subsp. enterica serovar Weltevreden]|nr:hypothetical protein KCP76_05670 [Salmonella enterica subsp. enterica serovar Weltevreden]
MPILSRLLCLLQRRTAISLPFTGKYMRNNISQIIPNFSDAGGDALAALAHPFPDFRLIDTLRLVTLRPFL